jgi:hypothetical protein
MKKRKYRIYRPNEAYLVPADNKEDAIFSLYCSTGMPEEFIKENFYIERVYK